MTRQAVDQFRQPPDSPSQAIVVEHLPNELVRLRRSDGAEVIGHVAKDFRKAVVRLLPGDVVAVDCSPFDPQRVRIVELLKSSRIRPQASHPIPPQQREQS